MELRVTDLDCTRGGMLVLQGISFTLQAEQALILRGPNGAGKTTLLRVLAGLQPPAAGQIDAPEEAIVYASHLDGLKDMLTVHENLAFWGAVYARPLGDVMARMNLSALADRPAGTLSAGQRRRLGLARLLVAGRPIWLLDEPTVSLDAESVALFAGILRDHLSSGGAALIATHIDLGLAAPVLDIGPFRARAIAPAGGFDEAFL